ncbi:MAG: ATP-dependent sacrificial sulfur transferase LarE [Pseudomonadales bacterium]|nr:ATP-dependent sacrificial sulfur transferase LarE [Pseudomonadales bacterium]NIX07967.1 ATP-dependent sacrificial sulfur transferase LarE [Pseudomonadales bacterium]
MNEKLAAKYEELKRCIAQFDSAIVAFSGGVDSSLVAYVAAEVLGPKALAVTSGSKSLKRSDLRLAVELAEKWGMQHRIIVTDELSKADYRANPVDRCFHCKTSLYTALTAIARGEGYAMIFSGTNCDDLGDHRPGLKAAADHGVTAPLVESGFAKADIRALADELGLENAQKPQSACLSSRFPYGTAIDEARLGQVEQAEEVLATFGFTQFRIRHHGDVARLELLPEEIPAALDSADAIETAIRACGYRFVAIDLRGFRSGSLNEGVVQVVNLPD